MFIYKFKRGELKINELKLGRALCQYGCIGWSWLNEIKFPKYNSPTGVTALHCGAIYFFIQPVNRW